MDLLNPIDCPYYLISRATLAVTSELKKGFASDGVEHVKPAHLGVLMSLWREDGLKVVELGRRAGLEPSTMTGLLDRMERDGLVYRSSDPEDRRVLQIYLTKSGKKIREPVLRVLDKIITKVFAEISEEDLNHTKNVLRQVLTNSMKEGIIQKKRD